MITATSVTKRGGELWRGLTDKTEWETKAAACKEKYLKAVAEFERNGGGGATTGNKKRSKAGSKKTVKKVKKRGSEEDEEESGSD